MPSSERKRRAAFPAHVPTISAWILAAGVMLGAAGPAASAPRARWVRLAAQAKGPGPRMGAVAAVDPSENTLVMWGGWSDAPRGDGWELPLASGSRWTRLAVDGGPSPRQEATAVLDPSRRQLILFGGKDDFQFHDDVWVLGFGRHARWTRVRPQGEGPRPRESRAAYDPTHDRVIVALGFGETPGGRGHLAGVWALSLAPPMRWDRLKVAGRPPDPRRGHSLVYDSRRRRLLLFGGMNDWGFYDDLWELSLGARPEWRRLATRGPRPGKRYGQVAVYDPDGDRLVMFGGYDGRFLNDCWVLDLAGPPTWSRLEVAGTAPAPRDFACGVWDASRHRMLVASGNDREHQFADVWALELPPASPASVGARVGAAGGEAPAGPASSPARH